MKFLIPAIILVAFLSHVHSAVENSTCNMDNAKSVVQIMDLVQDCHLLVLKRLSLPELVSIAETNEHFAVLSIDVFRQKYSKKVLKLRSPFSNNEAKHILEEDDKSIQLSKYNLIFKVLRRYGHLISKLEINYQLSSSTFNMRLINKLINIYCSESLIQLHVHNAIPRFFADFTKPFKNIAELSLPAVFDSLKSSTLSFNEIFPSVRRLVLNDIRVSAPTDILGVYSQLEHVEIEICDQQDESCFTEDIVRTLIMNNPQIRSLQMRFVDRKFLKFVAQQLPSLEHLKLSGYHSENDLNGDIHFDNLLSFRMVSGAISMPSHVHFEKLVEFHTDAQPAKCSSWIEFIENYGNLNKLSVIGRHLKDDEVDRIAEAHLDLNEVALLIGTDVTDETLIKLIKINPKLDKVSLMKFITAFSKAKIQKSMNPTIETLKQALADEWTIKNTSVHITLEKKH